MEPTQTTPQRQARLAFFNKGERVLADDQSTIAFCVSSQQAERIASALRATEGMVDPETAIREARAALHWSLKQAEIGQGFYGGSGQEAEYLERLTNTRKALALLGGRPV